MSPKAVKLKAWLWVGEGGSGGLKNFKYRKIPVSGHMSLLLFGKCKYFQSSQQLLDLNNALEA